jgi:hypothetical protein
MRPYDFSPLYRSTIGFDRLFDRIDQTGRGDTSSNWPPYNIERTREDDYGEHRRFHAGLEIERHGFGLWRGWSRPRAADTSWSRWRPGGPFKARR